MCKQKTAYEMRISDWSSDVCSSDLILVREQAAVDCGAEAARAVSRWGAPEIRNGDALLQWIEQELNIHRRLELRCFPGSGAQYLLVDNGLQARHLHRLRRTLAPFVEQALLRSEEHTSELQSLMRISYAVFCLKQKNNNTETLTTKS